MMFVRRALSLFLLLSLSLSAALVSAQESDDDYIFGDPLPTAPELAPRGDYGVGVTTMQFVNPDQIDLLNLSEDNPTATYDRELTVEVWYPAEADADAIEVYNETLGRADQPGSLVPFTFRGRAARDAEPVTADGPYPLVIVSHGYPGSRYLMTYLTENLASKGYVVVAIGHTESTFSDVASFGSTLLNRTLDQLFVLDQMAQLPDDSVIPATMVDADNTAIVGYSMGGYGALATLGAGYNEMLINVIGPAGEGLLDAEDAQEGALDERIQAAVLFAPWGGDLSVFGLPGQGFWAQSALADVTTPTFWVVGSQDDISGFEGVSSLYEGTVNSERYMLIYENALHNVAPNPPPPQAETLAQYERYADPVWDEARINNVNQHFITAFLGQHLKGEDFSAYLNLAVEDANEGVYAVDDEGNFTEEHTYWTGFAPRTALGMSLRQDAP